MTGTQFFVYGSMVLLVFIYIRKLWMKRGINHYNAAVVAAKIKARDNILLLDVRTAGERNRNQIRGSTHLPLHELKRRIQELEKFREKEIICYCQSGSRSLSAAHTLKQNGFRSANLSGGMSSWLLLSE